MELVGVIEQDKIMGVFGGGHKSVDISGSDVYDLGLEYDNGLFYYGSDEGASQFPLATFDSINQNKAIIEQDFYPSIVLINNPQGVVNYPL